MISASIATHTSVVDYLNMPIHTFYRVFIGICDVLEKRKIRQ